MKKIRLVKIELFRVEGPAEECVRKSFDRTETAERTLWEYADRAFRRWGKTAPELGSGYNKIDFKLTWEDGSEYKGRFDLVRGGRDDAGHSLSRHVRATSAIHAGLTAPAGRTTEEWVKLLDLEYPGAREIHRQLVEFYEMGPEDETIALTAAPCACAARSEACHADAATCGCRLPEHHHHCRNCGGTF